MMPRGATHLWRLVGVNWLPRGVGSQMPEVGFGSQALDEPWVVALDVILEKLRLVSHFTVVHRAIRVVTNRGRLLVAMAVSHPRRRGQPRRSSLAWDAFTTSHKSYNLVLALKQWSGRFLGLISSWDPSVCKSNRLHVEILRLPFIELGYVPWIPLKWSVILRKSWTPTGYFSNSTGSSATTCRFSPIIALKVNMWLLVWFVFHGLQLLPIRLKRTNKPCVALANLRWSISNNQCGSRTAPDLLMVIQHICLLISCLKTKDLPTMLTVECGELIGFEDVVHRSLSDLCLYGVYSFILTDPTPIKYRGMIEKCEFIP